MLLDHGLVGIGVVRQEFIVIALGRQFLGVTGQHRMTASTRMNEVIISPCIHQSQTYTNSAITHALPPSPMLYHHLPYFLLPLQLQTQKYQMTEEGSEKRSKRKICSPTKVSRLTISMPDIHAQTDSASFSTSSCMLRSAQRCCAWAKLTRISSSSLN